MTASISVVIPAFNAELFLRDAVASVLRQTHLPLEILVVDDGSTDETGRIADSLDGIRCLHQPNSGVSMARNRGIEEARGRFIAFLDADDAWDAEKLSIQVKALRDEAFAFSARTETDELLGPRRVVQGGCAGSLLEGLLFKGNVVGTPSSVVAPRHALLQAGGFDPNLSMCADWDMWIRLSSRLSGAYSERALVLYRVHGDSMSMNVRAYESDSRYMLNKAFGLGLPPGLMSRRGEAEARMCEVLAGCYWGQGARRDAFRCVVQSIHKQPFRLASLAMSAPRRMARHALRLSR